MTSITPRPVHVPRVAGVVADALRERILGPDMEDGDLLPKEDTLREEFAVGRPAIRESLRILEAEGLVRVVRGNRGGAVVHKPTAGVTAYTIGLALAARGVAGSDVGDAICDLEPLCADLCAKRQDRDQTVIPQLRRLIAQARASDDPDEVSAISRQFHEELVTQCGNATLSFVVGALERLWSCHVAESSSRAVGDVRPLQRSDQSRSIDEHEIITDLIEQGDSPGVRTAVAAHVARVQRHGATATSEKPINVGTLRDGLQP